MREIVHLQAGQCGNQIGAKVRRHTRFYDAIIIIIITSRSIHAFIIINKTYAR